MCRPIHYLLPLIAFLPFGCSTQTSPCTIPHTAHESPPAVGPMMQIVDLVHHHFGVMPSGKPGTYTCRVRNSGSQDLVLSLQQTSCGCTSVACDGEPMKMAIAAPQFAPPLATISLLHSVVKSTEVAPIQAAASLPPVKNFEPALQIESAASIHRVAPGGEARLEIRWKTGNFSGPVRQTVTIATNDPSQPRIELSVEGEVTTPVELSPPAVLLGGADGESPHGEAFVFSTSRTSLPRPKVEAKGSGLSVEIEPLSAAQLRQRGWKAGYRIRLIDAATRQGNEQMIRIATQVEEVPDLILLVATAGGNSDSSPLLDSLSKEFSAAEIPATDLAPVPATDFPATP